MTAINSFFDNDQVAMLDAATVRADLVVRFDFTTGTLYAWNGNTPLKSGDGNTYLPMYGTGQIDGLSLAGGTTSDSVQIAVNGLPDQRLDFLAAALAETPLIDQQTCVVSLQLFNDDWSANGSPIPLFIGAMQPPRINRVVSQDFEGGQQSITLQVENLFFNRSRPSYGRNTDRDQQRRSPGDKFFSFVGSLIFKTLKYPDF